MKKLLLAISVLVISFSSATAATISIGKFKKLDNSLIIKKEKNMSIAAFKKLDYELCKQIFN